MSVDQIMKYLKDNGIASSFYFASSLDDGENFIDREINGHKTERLEPVRGLMEDEHLLDEEIIYSPETLVTIRVEVLQCLLDMAHDLDEEEDRLWDEANLAIQKQTGEMK